MLHWTFKSLFAERVSVLAAAVGIMFALLLALYLDAVFRGEARQIVVFIERMPGEVWVLQDGVENLHMASTQLSEGTIAEVRRIPGAKSVMPILYGGLSIGDPEHERVAYVVGIPADPATREAWARQTGWSMPEAEGVVVPEIIAKTLRLEVGSEIRVGDSNHRISALSQGTFSMANPLVFLDERHARRALGVSDGANFLLVEPEAGVAPGELAVRIEAGSYDVRAITREQLRANDYELALQMGGALIGMLKVIATIVSALIVTFTAYAFVSSRTSELAVVKALGARRCQLLLSAMTLTCVVALLGSALAVSVMLPMEAVLTAWVPNAAVDFSFATAFRLSAATIVVALATAAVPALYLFRVDPALVFKG